MDVEKKCKLITLGAAGTGKTSILKQFVNHEFGNPIATVYADLFVKEVPVADIIVKFQIWDTVGIER